MRDTENVCPDRILLNAISAGDAVCYCPFGIDIGYMMILVRRICGLLKVAPLSLQDQGYSHMYTYSQAWVGQDDWVDTVQFVEEELRMDIKNAAYRSIKRALKSCTLLTALRQNSDKSPVQYRQDHDVARVDWTMPSFDGWDSTNQAMHVGDNETMGMVERMHFNAGFRLKVRKIVTSECGHSFRAAVLRRFAVIRVERTSYYVCSAYTVVL